MSRKNIGDTYENSWGIGSAYMGTDETIYLRIWSEKDSAFVESRGGRSMWADKSSVANVMKYIRELDPELADSCVIREYKMVEIKEINDEQ